MIRKIGSFFLALMLVVSLVVAPVKTEATATEAAAPDTCACGCGAALEDVQWRVWNPNGSYTSSGHYYLENNYIQDEQFGISAGEKIVLDLRGYELSGADYGRLFLNNGYLAVLDTVGGGKMSAKTAGNGFGGLLLMQTNATFDLYGGTVTVDADNKGSRRGGLISVGTNCTFNMYGGMLMGGSSKGTQSEEGGCIASAVSSAVIRILGGTVMGGYSPSHGGNIYSKGTLVLKDCKIIGGTAESYGGNIYQSGGSLTVENCEISHGVSKGTASTVTGGGNLCTVSSAKVTVKDTKIHNGYAASYGGNVYAGSGSQSFENVTITAGVCGLKGGNVCASSASTNITLKDCTADGEVSVASSLTLAGKTKISLRSTGLSLTGALNAKDLTEGAEIYLSAEGALPDAKAEYFKPAIRTVLTENENGLVATTAADGEIAGYCPHCNEQVAWTACGNTAFSADGHYYLSATQSSYGQKTINNDIVLDLNGFNLTGTSRAFFAKEGSALALLDSVGGSTVTMTGAADGHGGIIRNDKGNLKIFGGKYVLKAGKNVRYGGIIYTSGKTNIAGGVFDASVYENTTDNGANIYQLSGAAYSLNISAGYFMGGRTNYGGALYMGYNVKTSITGGHFTGGSAASNGGNLYVEGKSSYKTGTLQIRDVAVTKGQADNYGGNISVTYYETVSVTDAYIAGGNATNYGGNIHANTNSTFARYENCIIYGGSSQRGGNVYDGALGGRIRFTNCEILEGAASGAGGNICVNHGYVEIKGGTVAYGTAAEDGGNIYSAAGSTNEDGAKNYLKLLQDENGNAPVILGGVAGDSGGNIYFYGVCHLTAAHIQNGRAKTSGADLYRGKGSLQNVLSVGEGVSGNISIFVNSGLLGNPVYGQEVTGGTAETLNANITLEGDYGMPLLCAKDGKLYVAGIALISGETVTSYATASEAAAACKDGEYVKLYTDADFQLTRDCMVDLNGFAATVSGNGTIYGMDTVGTGKAVLEGTVQAAEVTYAPTGKIYIAAPNDTEITWHLLDMAITGVSIRPVDSGIYYTGKWSCDEALLAQLDSYGVAVDAVAAPGSDFVTNETTLWTEFEAATMVSGESKTGAIISGILKEERKAALNDAYGKMPVFAAAYVKLKSGTTVVSNAVGHSLYSVMQELETLVEQQPATYGKYMYNAGAFYRQWKGNGMGSWKFSRISIDPLCPWNYNVVEDAVQSGKMHYYFMSGEWHAYSGGDSEPEKWGDSCLIVFPDGQTMLIDTGVTQYGPILVENLHRMGVTKIDHLVISHPHSDHQNGAFSNKNNTSGVGILDQFAIGQVYHRGGYDSKDLASSQLVETVCAERNLPLQILEMGDTLQIGEVSIRVLWPKEGTSEKDTTGVNAAATNNTSVVMRFEYKNHSSLFTGDLYIEREAELIKTYEADVLDVDLLKAPHHGNGITSNSEDFLNAVSAQIAVATGFENITASTAKRFENAGTTLLNDRTYGYVHITTDGEDMHYTTSRSSAFSAGYAKVDITPSENVPMNVGGSGSDGISNGILDPLYATCVYLVDQKGAELYLIAFDLCNMYPPLDEYRLELAEKLGVDEQQLMFSASHTHSSVNIKKTGVSSIVQYNETLKMNLETVARNAKKDAKVVTGLYHSAIETENLNFVRRYVMNDGSYAGDNYGSTKSGYASHETEGDHQLQLVKFTRASGKDVILTNFQGHPHLTAYYDTSAMDMLSADVVGVYRRELEDRLDCHVLYYTGSSGNMNFYSRITSENVYKTYSDHGKALADYAVEAAADFKQLELGEIQFAKKVYMGKVNHSEDYKLEEAKIVAERFESGMSNAKALAGYEHLFEHARHAVAVVARAAKPDTLEVPLYAFSVGEFAVCYAPFELFAELGMSIKENSPFDATFVVCYSNNLLSYMPTKEAFDIGGYGPYKCNFEPGTGEILVEEYGTLLESLHKEQNSGELNGKRVLFVGNSFMHYGKAVLYNYTSTEEARHNDAGYFYQLCKSQGAEVDVVNWTYSGLSLQNIMDQHIPKFQDYNYDYVILNCDRSSTHTIESYEKLMGQYIQVFRGANPNVKMYLLVTSGTHNISVKETFPMDLLNNLDRIEAMDIRVLDWGKLVADIIRGETQVPGATLEYNKYSFIHNATAEDGYHPNQLTGYIISMYVYCAITGESAVGLPYDFWCDSSISNQFDPALYLDFGYKYGPTNYQEIFASPADMAGIQQLVDRYIADRSYLDYNFTEVPQN